MNPATNRGQQAIAKLLALAALLVAGSALSGLAQDAPQLQRRPTPTSVSLSIALTVPKGTPLEVAVEADVRVNRVNQPIRGRIVEPVYAFDKLVLPVGSEVTGKITRIESISAGRRTEAALNATLTPARKVEIEFDDIALPNGTHIAIDTNVTLGSGQLLDFVAATDTSQRSAAPSAAMQKARQARQLAHQQWTAAMNQVRAAGKIHRAERYALDQLPAHPQYIDAGSVYFAELQSPLDFGTEPLTPETARSIGNLPPGGAVIQARLDTALTSATDKKGDAVEAVVTQPLFEASSLVVPEGSVLSGTVLQVRSARHFSRNGQLRIAFHELRLPDGVEQKAEQEIEASLESVQSGKSAGVKLDSEGGAQATTSKTRYLSTAVALGLAGLSIRGDPDATAPNAAGNATNRMAGGAAGYKLVGIALGVFVHSRAFGYSMGAYGAGMPVYTHFIARGRDVVFPKDTSMQIALGTRDPGATPPLQPSNPGIN